MEGKEARRELSVGGRTGAKYTLYLKQANHQAAASATPPPPPPHAPYTKITSSTGYTTSRPFERVPVGVARLGWTLDPAIRGASAPVAFTAHCAHCAAPPPTYNRLT